jgi:peptidoglycan hydrolase-like protein with peptidoglycan-binding domain
MFGPRTRRAIADFQRTNNLQVDVIGRYDDITRDALLALLSVTSQGDVDTEVDVKAATVPRQNSGTPSTATTGQTETAGNDVPNNIADRNTDDSSTNAAAIPSAAPEPSAPPGQPTARTETETGHWAPEIQSLKQMGFTNEQLLREILDRNEGSVVETVSEMLRLASA